LHRQTVSGKGRGGDVSFQPHETPEAWRLLGSMELLSVPTRVELGNMVIDLLPRRKMEPVRGALAWTLGRVGARVPVYGPLNTVVPAEVAADWVQKLMDVSAGGSMEQLAAMQLARRTGDRYRDLEEKPCGKVIDWLRRESAPTHFIELVQSSGTLDTEEQGLVFGETLPKGLRIE
jgi:hypothetical protein